jgi:hypothetical protein
MPKTIDENLREKNLWSLSILSRLMPIAVLDVLEDFESRAC